MNKNLITSLIIFTFFWVGCLQKDDSIRVEKQSVDEGYIYHFIKQDSIVIDVGFTSSGNLKYVVTFTPTHDQLLLFNEETGTIKAKLKNDKKSFKTFGRAYYFYENSGNLSSDYGYDEGIRVGSARSYHDSTDRIKSIMLYNDSGNLYYRKNFDKYGNHLNTEGSKE